MSNPSVVIVSPAAPAANNGNARTAERWQSMLAGDARVQVTQHWPGGSDGNEAMMIALHARRSAPSIHAWAQRHPGRPLVVVLTGTDLYQDIASDADAQRSLDLTHVLVVLQECGADALPERYRSRARVIFQSTESLPAVPKPDDRLEAVMVGHLRAAKAPTVLFRAARRLDAAEGIHITHIGDGSGDAELAAKAEATAQECPHYQWLGPLPYDATRERIRRAHVLVHTSAMEGGAHVIMEAVCSGTPVLASRVPGNVGMLGAGYEGYFPPGDAGSLAVLLRACRAGLLERLSAQCAARAALFHPDRERAALRDLLRLAA